MPFCPQCGSELEEGAAFCGDCGTRIEAEAVAPPADAQPSRGGVSRWAIIGGAALVGVVVVGVALYAALRDDDDDSNGSVLAEATDTPVATQPSPPSQETEPTTTTAPTAVPTAAGFATPEEAIGAFLAQYGFDYVGDCETADIETDVGKYCSMIWEDRSDSRIYMAGLTFSEPDTWLLVSRPGASDGWVVADSAELVVGPEEPVPPW